MFVFLSVCLLFVLSLSDLIIFCFASGFVTGLTTSYIHSFINEQKKQRNKTAVTQSKNKTAQEELLTGRALACQLCAGYYWLQAAERWARLRQRQHNPVKMNIWTDLLWQAGKAKGQARAFLLLTPTTTSQCGVPQMITLRNFPNQKVGFYLNFFCSKHVKMLSHKLPASGIWQIGCSKRIHPVQLEFVAR